LKSYNFSQQKELFHLACDILSNYSITKNQWSFGGGTALSVLFYNHRMSYDIDIFIEDVDAFEKLFENREQIIKDLNLKKENLLASTRSLTFILATKDAGLKMDFVCFEKVSNYPNKIMSVFDIDEIRVQSVEEILSKKLKYRDTITVRDYVDFAYIEKKDRIITKLKKETFLGQDRFLDILSQLDDFSNEEFNEELAYMNPRNIVSKQDVEEKLSVAFSLNETIKVGCDSKEVVLFDEFIDKEISNYEEIEKIDVFVVSKTVLERELKVSNIKPNQLIGVLRKVIDKIKKG